MKFNYVEDIRDEFRRKKRDDIYRGDTIEIQNAVFRCDSPSIFGSPNRKYIDAEIEWYESQSRRVDDLFKIYGKEVQIWKRVANDLGKINSNYGWCVYSTANHRQYHEVLRALQLDPLSRQAVMIYNRPSMHIDSKSFGMNDFMCTTHVQYFLNAPDKVVGTAYVEAQVYMRSNDAIFGYPNDLAWQVHILKKLAKDLNVLPGSITWNVGSLHIYDRHWDLIK